MMLSGLAVALAAGVIPLAGVAGAQPNPSPCARGQGGYPPGGQQGQTVDRSTFRRGERGNVQGCASPRSRFETTLFSHPKPLGSGVADETGFYSLSFTIPSDAEIGGHRIVTTGTGVVDGVSTINVIGEQASAAGDLDTRGRAAGGAARAAGGGGGGGGALARTGSASTAPLTAAGVGLILIGGAAVVITRRRRNDAASVTQ